VRIVEIASDEWSADSVAILTRSCVDALPLPLVDHVEDAIPHQNGVVAALLGGFLDAAGDMIECLISEAINQVMCCYLDASFVHGGLA
jgi:hypothetical protein